MKISAYVTAAAFAALAIAARADDPAAQSSAKADKEKSVEKLMIAAQEICPVSGKRLGSMGQPIKAKSGKRTVFLCCKGCVGRPMKPKAWKQVEKNIAEAQGICPVMKKKLPKNAASTVVKGRTVFVCCKPCIKKLEKDPAKALAVVDQQLKKHVEAEKPAK